MSRISFITPGSSSELLEGVSPADNSSVAQYKNPFFFQCLYNSSDPADPFSSENDGLYD